MIIQRLNATGVSILTFYGCYHFRLEVLSAKSPTRDRLPNLEFHVQHIEFDPKRKDLTFRSIVSNRNLYKMLLADVLTFHAICNVGEYGICSGGRSQTPSTNQQSQALCCASAAGRWVSEHDSSDAVLHYVQYIPNF